MVEKITDNRRILNPDRGSFFVCHREPRPRCLVSVTVLRCHGPRGPGFLRHAANRGTGARVSGRNAVAYAMQPHPQHQNGRRKTVGGRLVNGGLNREDEPPSAEPFRRTDLPDQSSMRAKRSAFRVCSAFRRGTDATALFLRHRHGPYGRRIAPRKRFRCVRGAETRWHRWCPRVGLVIGLPRAPDAWTNATAPGGSRHAGLSVRNARPPMSSGVALARSKKRSRVRGSLFAVQVSREWDEAEEGERHRWSARPRPSVDGCDATAVMGDRPSDPCRTKHRHPPGVAYREPQHTESNCNPRATGRLLHPRPADVGAVRSVACLNAPEGRSASWNPSDDVQHSVSVAVAPAASIRTTTSATSRASGPQPDVVPPATETDSAAASNHEHPRHR